MRSKCVSSKFTLNSHKILKMGKTIVLTGAGGVLCGTGIEISYDQSIDALVK